MDSARAPLGIFDWIAATVAGIPALGLLLPPLASRGFASMFAEFGVKALPAYVRSSCAGLGVGRTIMGYLERLLIEHAEGYATLDASVNAVGFYRKLGYAPAGPRKDDGSQPMVKRLPAV